MAAALACPALISAEALKTLLASNAAPPPVLLDAGFDLADEGWGERSYRAGHLPGALYVHLERDLCGPTTGTDGRFVGRHPLRERHEYASLMGRWGIGPDTRVIVYDRQGAMFAARLWWTLRWMGHSAVQVLDGGVAAWERAGGALTTAPTAAASPLASAYPLLPSAAPTVQAEALRAELGRVCLIDARAPERFRGEVEPLDRVAGHIPGARNRFFKDNLQSDDTFKSAVQLRGEFEALLQGRPAEQVVHQCGSGVTACHNLLAMAVAGFAITCLYPGSWSEWSARGDDFPKAIRKPPG